MIIAYLRVSTGKQNPENQREEIKRFAEEKNMAIDQWVIETASGKLAPRKRKLGRVLSRMKKGDTLIVSEISRLSRSLTEIMTIMGQCLEKEISIYFGAHMVAAPVHSLSGMLYRFVYAELIDPSRIDGLRDELKTRFDYTLE